MRILAVGGGSGGHVTPVVAVLHEIIKLHPKAEIRFWCDTKFILKTREIVGVFDRKIKVQTVLAGKLRRYHHLSFFQHLFWPSLVLKNIGDSFLVILGFFQSLFKLIVWRPDVVFAKGGYVCLPVGLAARVLNIPLVIHDSDAYPGLTNRVLSRWAKTIATGAPLENYPYPKSKTHYVGVPISSEFHRFSVKEQKLAKELWEVSSLKPLLVVTGGGLGAKRMNDAVVSKLDDFIDMASVILISGTGQYDELNAITPSNSKDFQLHPFVSKNMAKLLGAADLVITRAGATTILELASLGKPAILIPNAKLSGGHQLKNAAVYAEKGAVLIVDEDDMEANPQVLVEAVRQILNDKTAADEMSDRFLKFARPDAAKHTARLVLDQIK